MDGPMCVECKHCRPLWWLNGIFCMNDESGEMWMDKWHRACELFEERGE